VGPAAWAAVGRALALALASAFFNGKDSVVVLLAKELEHAIAERDLSLAQILLKDLSYRHNSAFEDFIKEFGEELPPEARKELGLD
jgi:hypothetical protein